jgi:hypothetical protein
MTMEALARIQEAKTRKQQENRKSIPKIRTLSPEALRIRGLQNEIEKDDKRLGPFRLFEN